MYTTTPTSFRQTENLIAQMQQRVLQFLGELNEKHPNQTIFLSTHDGPINAIYAQFTNADLGEVMRTRYNPHDFVAKFAMADGKITSFADV